MDGSSVIATIGGVATAMFVGYFGWKTSQAQAQAARDTRSEDSMKNVITVLQAEIRDLRHENAELRDENAELRKELATARTDP